MRKPHPQQLHLQLPRHFLRMPDHLLSHLPLGLQVLQPWAQPTQILKRTLHRIEAKAHRTRTTAIKAMKAINPREMALKDPAPVARTKSKTMASRGPQALAKVPPLRSTLGSV